MNYVIRQCPKCSVCIILFNSYKKNSGSKLLRVSGLSCRAEIETWALPGNPLLIPNSCYRLPWIALPLWPDWSFSLLSTRLVRNPGFKASCAHQWKPDRNKAQPYSGLKHWVGSWAWRLQAHSMGCSRDKSPWKLTDAENHTSPPTFGVPFSSLSEPQMVGV